MSTTLRAMYRDGVFVPLLDGEKLDLPDTVEVELTVRVVADAEDAQHAASELREIAESMRANTFNGDPPRFTREELHERR
ncbi:MAG: hypothetical protein QOC96_520 [Acidobacteriota bacterium]|nr:hypothetical protein [Acidobacteriota bacterium]